jgi:hypothetical protein
MKIIMSDMNKQLIKIILVSAGAVLFSLVFWQEKLGINTLFFDAFIITALFYLYPNASRQSTVWWLLTGHCICVAMIVWHNTLLSKMAFSVTLLLMAVFAEYRHRSAWFAGGSVVLNMALMVPSFAEPLTQLKRKGIKRKSISRIIRFAIFPLLLLVVFFIIYSFANSVLQEIAVTVATQVELFVAQFFGFFEFNRVLFLLLGLLITGGILLKSKVDYFSKREENYQDGLRRVRIPLRKRMHEPFYGIIQVVMGRFSNGMLALKNEHTSGMISLALLNLLLLVVNVIDVRYLWFGFNFTPDMVMYKMVHEGAWLLIFSIVLAMLVLLFFFKGNLNFYKKNKWLKYGAYAWIVQNTILVMSVALRDYYYILHYGLAYKRIGVLVFLLMVLIGLVTVFIKIWCKRTNYFLFRVNAWAGIAVLVVATTVHWDESIAAYNLQRKETLPLDVEFLLSLSDKTLPLLEQNRAILQPAQKQLLNQREALFAKQQQELSWLSWNYADNHTADYFKLRGSLPGSVIK